MLELITTLNHSISNIVWGLPVLILLIGTGIRLTIQTGFFQLFHAKHILSSTIGTLFHKQALAPNESNTSISQFQALCTALAGTIGVGNIAGVAAAIVYGGPGAVFWMWLSAFFGMMTHYAEIVLGICYRQKNKKGEWCGGAMYYLRNGLSTKKGCQVLGKVLACLFAVFCIFASFGMGNMSQVNTISQNLILVFRCPLLDKTISIGSWYVNLYALMIGFILMLFGGLVILGGIQRISLVTERVVPFMAGFYMLGCLIVLFYHFRQLGEVLRSILSFAFGLRAVGGAAIGTAVCHAATWGLKRGVFSNEAGLGSSVTVHATANVTEPALQGMWGIFEVFFDTIIVCTLTAFVILSSGLIDLSTGKVLTNAQSTALVSEAFGTVFCFGGISFGSIFIAIAILFFAFATVLGWSYYGTKAWEFLFGTRSVFVYKICFVLFILIGATTDLELVWSISDTFNGLMAIPNLIGVLALSQNVVRITKEYMKKNGCA